MRKILTSIAPHQAGKLAAILYGLFALIMTPFGLVIFLFGGAARWGGLFLMIAPLFYMAAAYIFVAFACWLYNQIARRFGGIEFTVEESR